MVGPFDVASMLHAAEVCFWPNLQGQLRENSLPKVEQYGTALH